MAYSYNDVGEVLPTETITVPFPFLSRDHVTVLVDDVDVAVDTYWEWTNDGLITALTGFPSGTVTRVQRTTPDAAMQGTLVGTAVFDFPTTNNNFLQLLYTYQEKEDTNTYNTAALAALEATVDGVADDATAAAASAAAAAASETASGADAVATAADAVATAADVVLTNADVVSAAASAAAANVAKMTWQGGWLTATAYAVSDVVENAGASYVCTTGHTSGDTDDEPATGATWATYWDLVAERGADGTGDLTSTNNLSDVANVATAQQNLSLEPGVDVQAYDTDTAKTDLAQGWSTQRPSPQSLTYSATPTIDLTEGNGSILVYAELTGSIYFDMPTNCRLWDVFTIYVIQDATGSRAITMAAGYINQPGTFVTAASKLMIIDCMVLAVSAGTATKVAVCGSVIEA